MWFTYEHKVKRLQQGSRDLTRGLRVCTDDKSGQAKRDPAGRSFESQVPDVKWKSPSQGPKAGNGGSGPDGGTGRWTGSESAIPTVGDQAELKHQGQSWSLTHTRYQRGHSMAVLGAHHFAGSR